MIESFDNKSLDLMREEIQTALNKIAEKHGLEKLEMKSISYESDRSGFTTKIEAKTTGAAKKEFEKYASIVGLNPADFGKEFKSQGNRFKIEGINLRASKFPIICTNIDNKKGYKFPRCTCSSSPLINVVRIMIVLNTKGN
jgi:hypothetical protein